MFKESINTSTTKLGNKSSSSNQPNTGIPGANVPPATNPPVTNPPATNPPETNPPVTNPPVTTPPAAPGLAYLGRWDRSGNAAVANWSGSSIKASFEGTTQVSVRLEHDAGNGWIVSSLDGGALKRLQISNSGTTVLYQNISTGTHVVQFWTEQETMFGKTTFRGFDFGSGRLLAPPTPTADQLEVIGDSITCGFGNIEARKDTTTTNTDCTLRASHESSYMAYGSVLGRLLGADTSLVCYSGLGVYRDGDGNTANQIPTRYLSLVDGGTALSRENYTSKSLVVINLGTNDIGYNWNVSPIQELTDILLRPDGIPNVTSTYNAWVASYRTLIRNIRTYNPTANIFMTLGTMKSQSTTDAYVRGLNDVANQVRSAGDTMVHVITGTPQNSALGLGCNWHPTAQSITGWRGGDSERFASELAGKIRTILPRFPVRTTDPIPLPL